MALLSQRRVLAKRVSSLFKMPTANFASTFMTMDTKPEPLETSSQELLLKRPWATNPFPKHQDLKMPIYKLLDGEYSGECVNLDPETFNNPIRRDLIHNAFIYYRKLGWQTFKKIKTKGTTAGSGRKPFPQKGRGKARQGNIRSSINKGGGKAHGPVPRDRSIELNSKVLLQSLKSCLSALLYEKRLVFVDSESIHKPKTKILANILKNFDDHKLLFVAPINACPNFISSTGNIPFMRVVNANELNVKNALKSDFIFLTKQSLADLELILEGRYHENYLYDRRLGKAVLPADELLGIQREKKPDFFKKVQQEMENYEFDETKEYEIHTSALQDYLDKAIEYDNKKKEMYDTEEIMWVNKKD